jgi:hypothetical protein
MTQMEEIVNNIEKSRLNLQNLINTKHSLIDGEIINASQKLDNQLNMYHNKIMKNNKC